MLVVPVARMDYNRSCGYSWQKFFPPRYSHCFWRQPDYGGEGQFHRGCVEHFSLKLETQHCQSGHWSPGVRPSLHKRGGGALFCFLHCPQSPHSFSLKEFVFTDPTHLSPVSPFLVPGSRIAMGTGRGALIGPILFFFPFIESVGSLHLLA